MLNFYGNVATDTGTVRVTVTGKNSVTVQCLSLVLHGLLSNDCQFWVTVAVLCLTMLETVSVSVKTF